MTTTNEPLVAGEAFKALLSSIDPKSKIKELTEEVKLTKSASKKDALIKQIKYLNGLVTNDMRPEEAYIIHNVPVLPPVMRPATTLGGNRIEFSDVNSLYKDHMLTNKGIEDNKDILPASELVNERAEAYAGLKAIVGLGEAISPNSRGRNVKGLLRQIAGTTGPKTGLFQQKILSKKQDFSGRATIYSEPNLGFNEAAVPHDILWDMYKLHMLRELSKNGYDYINATKAYDEKTPAAVQAFNKVITKVPLILNRAPTLMRSNVTAVYPVPIKGTSMGLNPMHHPLFASDTDGDAFSLFVPMSPEAVEEAKQKLLPSNQIFDARKGIGHSLIAPAHESIIGAEHMTNPDMKQAVRKFKSEKEVLAALERGEIKENQPIELG